VFLDLNAKPHGHWFYREFLDRFVTADKEILVPGVNYGHFTVFDNLSLDETKLQGALDGYDKGSAWYQRDILGKRGGGSDVIYAGFGAHLIKPLGELPKGVVKMAVGVDVGGRDATAATLVGVTGGGELVLFDGYYHKQGAANYMTHEKYVREIGSCVERWATEYPAFGFGGAVFCESAEKLFRAALAQELRRRGLNVPVHPSYKKDGVLDRIRLFSYLINQNRLIVAKHLEPWVRALSEARWNEKAKDKGEWVRVDDGSYPLDCLDSAEYGAVPFRGMLLKG
jgi:PBSX family phage terminase large subunit